MINKKEGESKVPEEVVQEQKNKEEKKKEPEQIIEGYFMVKKGEDPYEKVKETLPKEVTSEMVDLSLGRKKGEWRWHLKPEFIKDPEKRKQYEEEKEKWLEV